MKSRWLTGLWVGGGLVLAGVALRSLGLPAGAAQRSNWPAADGPALPSGATFGLLGGFRAIAADLVWLQAYISWERRETAATYDWLRLATAIDPQPLAFWVNGARIIAYDMPAWRMAADVDERTVPTAGRRQIVVEQAALALRQLDAAAVFHPRCATLWVERAGIELNQLV